MTAIAWAALGIAALAVSGLIGFGVAALAARKEAGLELAARTKLEGELAAAVANGKTQSARADFQEKRANALDAAIVRHAATQPVAGSFELLKARELAAAGSPDGRGAGGLHHEGDGGAATETLDPDRLLKPGE